MNVALLFEVGGLIFEGAPMGTEYFAGYVTEKARRWTTCPCSL